MSYENSQNQYADPQEFENLMKRRAGGRLSREKNYRLFEKILDMFGNEKARENFLALLQTYYKNYLARERKFSSEAEGTTFEKGRAALHDTIKRALQRLSLTAKPGSEEEKIIASLYDRDAFHKAVGNYFSMMQNF